MWFLIPTQLAINTQWWSNPRTQLSQVSQWDAFGGLLIWHVLQFLYVYILGRLLFFCKELLSFFVDN